MSLRTYQTWHLPCGSRTLTVGERTLIMGILNVTPDSFSDGGRYDTVEQAVTRALTMIAEGADIIDVGGESTRPGSQPVSAAEERDRVIPVIRALRAAAPEAFISIDTYKAGVADEAVAAGANIINDVWGLRKDPDLAAVAARRQTPVILMHNQSGTQYQDLMADITAYLSESIATAVRAGLPTELTIVDPGIGFGKTATQNLQVLNEMPGLQALQRPILLGFSRKSTIGKVLGGLPAGQRLEGTAATVALGIDRGADIIRVHDVAFMKRVAVMTDAVVRPGRGGFYEH